MRRYGILKPQQEGLFIFSLANFLPVIKRLISFIEPMSFCEIGIEGKIMTQMIIEMASSNHLKVYGIDPTVSKKPDYDNYILINKPSFTGLEDVEACDVYFVDGDHNYYTVSFELNKIQSIASSKKYFPVIFVHDVAWPNDRRDSYYLPTFIPDQYINDYDIQLGVKPENDNFDSNGIASQNNFYVWRKVRGGEKNGVLTAIEDFLEKNHEWNYVLIPGIFGMGILYKNSCPKNFIEFISVLNSSVNCLYEHISMLEYNRLELFCEKIKLERNLELTMNELSIIKNSRTWRWGKKFAYYFIRKSI